jgi:hypothetical protein
MIEAIFSTIIPAIVGALTSLGGSFLYYRQTRVGKDLDNKAKEADISTQQTKSLLEVIDYIKAENQRVREENAALREKNDGLALEANELKISNARLAGERCNIFSCQNRRPPLKEIVEGS